MQTTFKSAVENYLRAKPLSRGTRNEYFSTLRKWEQWGVGAPIEELRRKDIREFLDWVYELAVTNKGTNPGRTSNKAREHLRAVISWAWEQELIDSPPRFPKPRDQRDVAGRHYLTKAEINALYFATHRMKNLQGWDSSMTKISNDIWRAWLPSCYSTTALIQALSGNPDTFHQTEYLATWLSWDPRQSPDREIKEQSRLGWLFYRRVKTGKLFYRPMNRVVHAHLKAIMPASPNPDSPVFLGGGAFNHHVQIPARSPRRHQTSNEHRDGKGRPWVTKASPKNMCNVLR